jgi:hypothetical protein
MSHVLLHKKMMDPTVFAALFTDAQEGALKTALGLERQGQGTILDCCAIMT